MNDTVFKEFAMLSMGRESEEWFCTLCKGMKEEKERKFDETCQRLMADIWGCLRNSAFAKKNSVEASHQYQVHTYMQGLNNESDFGELMKGMPVGLQNRNAVCILCQHLSQFLFHDWIPDSLEKICQVLPVPGRHKNKWIGSKTRSFQRGKQPICWMVHQQSD
jgi:hypothetical protein